MGTLHGRTPGMHDRSTTMQSAAGANGNGTAIALTPNDREINLSVVGATAVLDVVLEVEIGGAYENAFAENLLAATGIGTLVNTINNPGTTRYRYRIPAGATNIRARVANFVSGTVTAIGIVRGQR